MSITVPHVGGAASGGLTEVALTALRRWQPATFQTIASRLLDMSWSLHVLAAVGVILPTGNKREATELLAGAGFQLHFSGPAVPDIAIPVSRALVMRPAAVDDTSWMWHVAYDGHVPADTDVASRPQLSVTPSWAGAAAGVTLEPTVSVLSVNAEIAAGWLTTTGQGSRS